VPVRSKRRSGRRRRGGADRGRDLGTGVLMRRRGDKAGAQVEGAAGHQHQCRRDEDRAAGVPVPALLALRCLGACPAPGARAGSAPAGSARPRSRVVSAGRRLPCPRRGARRHRSGSCGPCRPAPRGASSGCAGWAGAGWAGASWDCARPCPRGGRLRAPRRQPAALPGRIGIWAMAGVLRRSCWPLAPSEARSWPRRTVRPLTAPGRQPRHILRRWARRTPEIALTPAKDLFGCPSHCSQTRPRSRIEA
jgi:hypothetical protein